jgi:hypothetical protein
VRLPAPGAAAVDAVVAVEAAGWAELHPANNRPMITKADIVQYKPRFISISPQTFK